ncbi:AAA family ATPase [Streptomyces sp. WAC05374]|uniref:AAA family ATPase n=2 Tax=Streptomyces sp. WAC05374 TaxID=2487420 RepID=UPI001055D280|nr:MoxR family ATPase [Streptomyces sp. WAC05374]TDF43007.1 AAA family ATPase [Streptomyces sp. WAC05374]TDF46682.1 AAA family ATPase [Streptomyces sp. WAC05374]TDF48876.1 AAA family ATPase [Streptomyces sp. WAC05374]
MDDWLIYRGQGQPDPERIGRLPDPPRWRRFSGEPLPIEAPPIDHSSTRRLGTRAPLPIQDDEALQLINAALYLRRPLLVTGEPGSGKSTLAHAVAHELGLGRVLQWPIVSRSELRDGLYAYDAIGRLHDAQLSRERDPRHEGESEDGGGIGRYIRLGPLGTALLPGGRPRVLLIDELDKSDIDLPNDLLNVLEEGEFRIPELERIADRPGQRTVHVLDEDGRRVPVTEGRVTCHAFPFVVMTSNGERDFPAPLLRRCIHLKLEPPRNERLAALVQAHFGDGAAEDHHDLLESFTEGDHNGELRLTDQLLNAIFLTQFAAREDHVRREEIADLLMRPLDQRPQR